MTLLATLSRVCLAAAVTLAALAPAAEARCCCCPCPGARHVARVAHAHAARYVVRHAARRSYRRVRAVHGKRARRPLKVVPQEQGAGPVFLGDLYITAENTPLWQRPVAGAQILAKLPKRTVMTNMGRVALTNAAGRVVAYFYKVEAPNGKVGYVNARWLSPNPPEW